MQDIGLAELALTALSGVDSCVGQYRKYTSGVESEGGRMAIISRLSTGIGRAAD